MELDNTQHSVRASSPRSAWHLPLSDYQHVINGPSNLHAMGNPQTNCMGPALPLSPHWFHPAASQGIHEAVRNEGLRGGRAHLPGEDAAV